MKAYPVVPKTFTALVMFLSLFSLSSFASVSADTFWTGSLSGNINSVNTGNVGIGTSSPTQKLDVVGWIKAQKAGDTRITLSNTEVGGSSWSWANDWSNLNGFSLLEEGISGNRIFVKPGGNIGIGTVNPGGIADYSPMLHVKGNTNSNDSHWSGRIIASGPTNAVVMGELLSNHKAVIGGHSADLSLWSDLIINPVEGNVGIGNSNPTAKLRITGNGVDDVVRIDTGVGGADLRIKYGGENEKVSIGSWSAGGLHFYTTCTNCDPDFQNPANGGVQIYPRNGNFIARGSMAVGTTTLTEKLHVAGNIDLDAEGSPLLSSINFNNNDLIQYNDTENLWTFSYDGNTSFAINDNNVGLGTITPDEKLEVNGNIKVNGNIVSDGDICIGNCN